MKIPIGTYQDFQKSRDAYPLLKILQDASLKLYVNTFNNLSVSPFGGHEILWFGKSVMYLNNNIQIKEN